RKIGLPLLGIGAALTLLGVSLFFNKMLMRLGNLFFVAGVPMTIGPGRTAGYFFQPKKARATACLSLGIILVFAGRPILGILLEVFGFINLFGNMFPLAFAIMKQMPFIGPLL
ncbi:Got1-like protein, partial [Fragilariopsis cylindrus CCMP1102]